METTRTALGLVLQLLLHLALHEDDVGAYADQTLFECFYDVFGCHFLSTHLARVAGHFEDARGVHIQRAGQHHLLGL